ncbi:MAG: hypothetical protein H6686_04050 [Fibrobacteria bacterium]|nr:hypothetical protein [Fibrobacteria bacterium]
MAINHAMKFLKDLDGRPELRDALYMATGYDHLFRILAEAGYPFSGGEFEEAVDHLHVACATHEDADALMNKAHWFRMVSANA